MKASFIVSMVFLPIAFWSQIVYEGKIKDFDTKKEVPYCAVGIKNTARGVISNEEGVVRISGDIEKDTLVFVQMGYQKKEIALSQFVLHQQVFLKPNPSQLGEVSVFANDDYLYDLLSKCQQSLFWAPEQKSKAYFVLESKIDQQPVELLECYYNSVFTRNKVKDLRFKNGRVGVAPYGNRFFLNKNTSKVFYFIDLVNAHKDLPINPFQLNNKKLRKHFKLIFEDLNTDEDSIYHISFRPLKNVEKFYRGEVWIEKKSGHLRKILLSVSNTGIHPFLPLFPSHSKINSVSMQITKVYSKNYTPEHIDFNYQINYSHIENSTIATENRDTTFVIHSKGLLYFYDFGQEFSLPYFTYNVDFDDYRKIVSLGYNSTFWEVTKAPAFTSSMKEAMVYFVKKGAHFNFSQSNKKYSSRDMPSFFENNFIIWSGKKRLALKNGVFELPDMQAIDKSNSDLNSQNSENVINSSTSLSTRTVKNFISDDYNLKSQIFMDLNPINDSVQHYTASVFDVFESFYNLQKEPYTNCFFNIYFDLFEIERQNLEKKIKEKKRTISEIDSLYKQSVLNLEEQTSEYLNKVQRGKNLNELKKWNDVVFKKLGINNFLIFGIEK